MGALDLRAGITSMEDFKECETLILQHYTTTALLEEIQEKGLVPPVVTNNFSNKDYLFAAGDEEYIYFTLNKDRVFADNAVEKFGGKPVVLDVIVKKDILEVDDVMNNLKNDGIDIKNEERIFNKLTKEIYKNVRTKQAIKPGSIIGFSLL